MKRFGPPMKDRRDKRLTERSARERFELDDTAEPCETCGKPTYRWGGYCSRECERAAPDKEVT